MHHIYNYITIGMAFFLTLIILLQTRGAGLGAGFGSAGEIETVRRGSDKTLFQMTIIAAIIFVVSIILGIISK
jgi:preprotein translocase subunit SecG